MHHLNGGCHENVVRYGGYACNAFSNLELLAALGSEAISFIVVNFTSVPKMLAPSYPKIRSGLIHGFCHPHVFFVCNN